jgi:hypothetical protein
MDEFRSLAFKQVFIWNAESGIFLIRTPAFRGFQYGNPESGDRRITDDLYSQQGMIGFTFLRGKSGRISQAEINRVIQTVAPIIGRSSESKTIGAQPVR